jgi:ribonuclease BN (tRNA processing enzyme)
MKIKVLGCSGAEFPGRNPSGFLLDDKILFDAGSLTRVLDIKDQLKVGNIFITHAHLDHVIGIPFLLDNIAVGNIRHKVNIIGLPSVLKAIKKNILNNSIWPDFTVIPNMYNGIVSFTELKAGQSMKINGCVITPYKVNHSVPAAGYLVENEGKKRFFYTGDTGPTSATWKKLRNIEIHCLIIEVSFPNKMEEIAIKSGHLTPQLLEEELSKMKHLPEKIYITHLKPQYCKTVKGELQKLKIKNLRLLRDGETIRI